MHHRGSISSLFSSYKCMIMQGYVRVCSIPSYELGKTARVTREGAGIAIPRGCANWFNSRLNLSWFRHNYCHISIIPALLITGQGGVCSPSFTVECDRPVARDMHFTPIHFVLHLRCISSTPAFFMHVLRTLYYKIHTIHTQVHNSRSPTANM